MKAYHNSAVLQFDDSTTGNAGAGVPVTVRLNSTQALVSIFDLDEVAIANPTTTDSKGNYAFKTADGVYDIIISEGTSDEVVLEKVQISEFLGLINDLSQAYEFDTVALMKISTIVFPLNKRLITRGYYEVGDGGGASYLIKTAAQATSDGDVIDGFGNHALDNSNVAIIQTYSIVNVKQYGAKGDVVTDDVLPIQAALDFAGNHSVLLQSTPATGTAANFPSIMVFFPPSKGYAISAALLVDYRYSKILGASWSMILRHGTYNSYLLEYSGINFEVDIKGINFASTSVGAVKFDSTNVSDARVNFEDCKFSGNSLTELGTGVTYTNTSSSLTFKRCYFQAIAHPAHILSCDFTSFEDCWFSFAALAVYGAADGYIRNDAGFMRINNCIFSGGPSLGGSQIAYVNCGTSGSATPARVTISKTRIGFETGAGALVNYLVTHPGDVGTNFRSGITLSDIQTAPREDTANAPDGVVTAPLIRLFTMPQQISIDGAHITQGRLALIVAGSTTTLAALRASVPGPFDEITDMADQVPFNTANSFNVQNTSCPILYTALTTDVEEDQKWAELFNRFNYYFPSSSPGAGGGPTTITVDTFFENMVSPEGALFIVKGGGRMVASGTPSLGAISGIASVLYNTGADTFSGVFHSQVDYSGLPEGITTTVVFTVAGVEFTTITLAQAPTAKLRIKMQATSNPGVAPIRCRGLVVRPYISELLSMNNSGVAQST